MELKEMRKLLGLSQSAFGKRYNIPVRTIQDWESGRRKAPIYVIELLERAVVDDFKDEKRDD
jgi:putative transcriptional regulator